MEPVKEGQIRVHLKNAPSYDCPEGNKANVIRCVSDILRVEHYKPPKPPKTVEVTVITPKPPTKKRRKKKKSGSV